MKKRIEAKMRRKGRMGKKKIIRKKLEKVHFSPIE